VSARTKILQGAPNAPPPRLFRVNETHIDENYENISIGEIGNM